MPGVQRQLRLLAVDKPIPQRSQGCEQSYCFVHNSFHRRSIAVGLHPIQYRRQATGLPLPHDPHQPTEIRISHTRLNRVFNQLQS
jgi:hypothetical protein